MRKMGNVVKILIGIFLILGMSSCVQKIKEKTGSNNALTSTNKIVEPSITKIYMSGSDKIIVEGENLSGTQTVTVSQGSSTYDLTISSKTNSLLALTVAPSVRFFTDVAYTFFVSNAYAQATFPVTFVIDDAEITSAKIADGAITAAKIDSMGANSGQALIYNGSSWTPGNLGGLNFMGSYTPAAGTPPSGTPNNGEFWIVDSTVVSVDIDGAGATGTTTYVSGDWVVYDSNTASWLKIDNNSTGNFWTKSSSDVNYTAGDVSIGTTLTPTLFNLYDTNLLAVSGDGTALQIDGDVLTGTQWARGISFGLESTRHVRVGAEGTTDGTTSSLNSFYINTNSADPTPWTTAQFVITNAGYVGINNQSPTTELDVTGTITASNFIGDGSGITNVVSTGSVTNASNSVLTADNDGDGSGEIQFQINGVTQGIIDNAGNMGVGTTTTRSELDIRSTAQTETSIISYQDNDAVLTLGSNSGLNPGAEVTTLTGTTLGTVGFAGYDGTNFSSTSSISSASTEAWGAAAKGSNLIFSTTTNGAITATERMRISHSGNVGIANAAPAEALDVTGNIQSSGNIIVGGNATVTGTITSTGTISGPMSPTGGLSVSTSSGTYTASNYVTNLSLGVDETSAFLQFPLQTSAGGGPTADTVFGIGVSQTDGALRIVRSSAKSGATADNSDLVIDEGGDVTVANNLTVTGNLNFGTATGTFSGAVSGTTGTFSSNLSTSAAATVGADLTVDTNTLHVDSTNNRVGVLNLTPAYTLDVTGDVHASGSVYANSTCELGVCTSDRRYKKNIEEVEEVSDRFANIRTVEYEWRTDEYPNKSFHHKKEVGVIAQEVREQFPELVHEDDDGYLKVDKSKLQAYAMKALKEQIKRNDRLERENEQMKEFLCSKYADAPFCQ